MTISERIRELARTRERFSCYVASGRLRGRIVDVDADSFVLRIDGTTRMSHIRTASVTNIILDDPTAVERVVSRDDDGPAVDEVNDLPTTPRDDADWSATLARVARDPAYGEVMEDAREMTSYEHTLLGLKILKTKLAKIGAGVRLAQSPFATDLAIKEAFRMVDTMLSLNFGEPCPNLNEFEIAVKSEMRFWELSKEINRERALRDEETRLTNV